ncbi:hypothetical protein DFO73_101766 [Cytobacillus oceanisediminis]|jgi:hypothetical protein|uniref:Uncharacterized protein n=1 Tax=Cytobacillus oceanisediminis TaxID=665099 RepID=A0A2V3A8L0_9BACI|nr:hypothetical protein DFO73_101766 [Cytobacillus oceanisediminis]
MALSLNARVLGLETPGIRKFSNQLVHFPDTVNLTIGQPDFPHQHILKKRLYRPFMRIIQVTLIMRDAKPEKRSAIFL